ncbi:acetoacetate--CoA ligase [Natronoglycomyces albus]|uniref:acetoacetate--CoA ligase n=1 Tax=Natronoglycomyces albus TaxID=2811108 RepID=UPI001FE5CD02|nr:acetoacetate--CoA ligase [Natronoglycomyces albus]
MTTEVLWIPPSDAAETTNIGRYSQWLSKRAGTDLTSYPALWQYSVDQIGPFWGSIWEYFHIGEPVADHRVLTDETMPFPVWFPDQSVNYAKNMLAAPGVADDDVIIKSYSDTREAEEWTLAELRDAVARCRTGLKKLGVDRGDRVAAWMPNIPETLVLLLASASLGAVFSSCAPEFGPRAVLDRIQQIEPKVLVTVDGYRYGRKDISRVDQVAEVKAGLPGLQHVVHLPYLTSEVPDGGSTWDQLLSEAGPLEFAELTFEHPLYVLFSSGTTGLPKAIIHSHGGIILEHAKALGLHHNLGPGDLFFWFTTTGWMMWNYQVSSLLVGSGMVMFDGAPTVTNMWELVEESGTTFFGTSAPYLMACRKAEVTPKDIADLSKLHGIGSTGAPLPADGFDYVYSHITQTAQLQSISGGTDLCTGFVGGAPTVPVWRGEISARCLGARVESYDSVGDPGIGREGELVITKPMPCMPVGLWGDAQGLMYETTYYLDFPGIWRHGDWITITERGSCVISGRSDATLNRGGVRMGTAEFYAVVENIDEVADSLVVHFTEDDADDLVLFVALADGATLTDDLEKSIRANLKNNLSPRHLPDRIEQVNAIPRTLSGKKVEVPVKKILLGTPPEEAVSMDSLANPDALRDFFPDKK